MPGPHKPITTAQWSGSDRRLSQQGPQTFDWSTLGSFPEGIWAILSSFDGWPKSRLVQPLSPFLLMPTPQHVLDVHGTAER